MRSTLLETFHDSEMLTTLHSGEESYNQRFVNESLMRDNREEMMGPPFLNSVKSFPQVKFKADSLRASMPMLNLKHDTSLRSSVNQTIIEEDFNDPFKAASSISQPFQPQPILSLSPSKLFLPPNKKELKYHSLTKSVDEASLR